MQFREWFNLILDYEGVSDSILGQSLNSLGWRRSTAKPSLDYALDKVVNNPLETLMLVQDLAAVVMDSVDLYLKEEYWPAISNLITKGSLQEKLTNLVTYLNPPYSTLDLVNKEAYPIYIQHSQSRDFPVNDEFNIWFIGAVLDTIPGLKCTSAFINISLAEYGHCLWSYPPKGQESEPISYYEVPLVGPTTHFLMSHGIYMQISPGDYHPKIKLYFKDLNKILSYMDFTNLVWVVKRESKGYIGRISPVVKLDNFSLAVQEFTRALISNTNTKVAALIYGAPGTGKSSYALALAAEYFTPKGYMTVLVLTDEIKDFKLPNYLSKVLIIVNDADTVADKRTTKVYRPNEGGTESVLSMLDGTLTNLIKFEDSNPDKHIVWLFTANSRERMDEAFLRKGRIDYQFEFTEVYV